MNAPANAKVKAPKKPVDLRLPALRRFATAITILNVVGRLVLGFEPSWAQMFVAMATAYSLETFLEWIDARVNGRRPAYLGHGVVGAIDFLLPGHITALACSMLTYSGEALLPAIFATTVGVASKFIFRAPVGRGERHFLNPSNTGILITILFFPRVSVAPPYQFSEYTSGTWDFILPCIFITAGTMLNGIFTKKLPLIAGWLSAFALQAVIRHFIFGTWLDASLATMTGLALLLYTFYMVSDPATTPTDPRRQVLFGASVAVTYGVLMAMHIVYGLFIALFVVCTVRGIYLLAIADRTRREARAAGASPMMAAVVPAEAPAPARVPAEAAALGEAGAAE